MSEQNISPIYQVIATCGDPDVGEVSRLRLSHKPVLIGSGANAELQLDSAAILPVHARLFLTATGQVMLTNLGATGSIILEKSPLPEFACIHWKPGVNARLGEYELTLVTLAVEGTDNRVEYVRPSLVTQESDPVLPAAPFLMEADRNQEQAVAVPVFDDVDSRDTLPEVSATPPLGPLPQALPLKPPVEVKPPPQSPDKVIAGDTLNTPVGPFLRGLPVSDDRPAPDKHPAPETAFSQTLPKDWRPAGSFSAQPISRQVNFVAGERIYVPVSVRNDGEQELQVRAIVTGVPRSWVILPDEPLTLAPGEIGMLDLILHTQPPGNRNGLDMKVWLSDYHTPEIAVTLSIRLNFKSEPNLVGNLDPPNVDAVDQAYLHLQNHTQAMTEVFVAGHCRSKVLTVIPVQPQVTLPPGQKVSIPFLFRITQRPLLRSVEYTFSVSAVHANRAPLDFPGKVRVESRLSRLFPWSALSRLF